MADMARFTIYVSEAELQQLSIEAERQGSSINFVIRSILREKLSQLSQVTKVGNA